jgi:Flp pilus assembly protein TadG
MLARIVRDRRGNALAIVAAALVPLTAIIGSGVDMSRAYMAKTRLQSACDAAALAGRRVMEGDRLGQNVVNEANRFFRFNFPQGLYNTGAFTPAVTSPSSGTVRVTASTAIPTTIMRMFGFTTLPLDATCDASLNFVNTDVMLVLDVTGSMDRDVNGNFTWSNANKKITALREAVMALYDELRPVQTQLEGNGLRLRYGVVPYSSTVNVGTLIRDVNPDYLADSVSYQTRIANYTRVSGYAETGETTSRTSETYSQTLRSNACQRYGSNRSYPDRDGDGPFSSGSEAEGEIVEIRYEFRDWGGTGTTGGNRRTCRRWRHETRTGYAPRVVYDDDEFAQRTFDTSEFKLGTRVPVALDEDASDTDDDDYQGYVPEQGSFDLLDLARTATGVPTVNSRWNGCIEARRTVSTITNSSGYAIPSGAYDLNINLIPYNEATRWRPQWPELVWRRSSSSRGESVGESACPAEAVRLQAWNRGQLQSYVNQLEPTGSTYHDIGMVWGARMISPEGVFGDSPDTHAGMPVSRHIIFMTDGHLEPTATGYTGYGVEVNDQRITGSSSASGQADRHMQRFRMVCNAAKTMNVSIWVIAFGTSLRPEMVECASNENQASTSANRDQLIERFRQIGNRIGALRLTQ